MSAQPVAVPDFEPDPRSHWRVDDQISEHSEAHDVRIVIDESAVWIGIYEAERAGPPDINLSPTQAVKLAKALIEAAEMVKDIPTAF